MSDDRRPLHGRARPLDRAERSALAALADQIDRESPTLAIGLRGAHRTATRPGGAARRRRGLVRVVLFVFAVAVVAAGAVGSGLAWGPAGLAISAGVLVGVLAALTLNAACR